MVRRIVGDIGHGGLTLGDPSAAPIAAALSNVPTNIQKNAPSLPSGPVAGPKLKLFRPGIFLTSGMCTSRKCVAKWEGSFGFGYMTTSLLMALFL